MAKCSEGMQGYLDSEVAKIKITVAPNPSHLEAINPVVQVSLARRQDGNRSHQAAAP